LNATAPATAATSVASAPASFVFPDISVIIGLKEIMDPFNPNIDEVDRLIEVAKGKPRAYDLKTGWNFEALARHVLPHYYLRGFAANWENPHTLANASRKLHQSLRSGACLTLLHENPNRSGTPNFVVMRREIVQGVSYELISSGKQPVELHLPLADFLARWRRQVIVVVKT
jgi:hypothetical protein